MRWKIYPIVGLLSLAKVGSLGVSGKEIAVPVSVRTRDSSLATCPEKEPASRRISGYFDQRFMISMPLIKGK